MDNRSLQSLRVDGLTAAREAIEANIEATTFSIAEACRALGISRRTYYRWVEDGRLQPRHTINGRARIPKQQVLNYIEELQATTSIRRALAASTAAGHPAA